MKSIVILVFRPEAQLTLLLRMRTEKIAKTAKKYSGKRDIPVTANQNYQCEWRGQMFDQGQNLQIIESFS